MTATDHLDIDDRLATHLRHTLHAVARTITTNAAEPESTNEPRRPATRHSKRPVIAVASLGALAACGLAAWHQLEPGEIERIPTEALITGTTPDGTDWWLIPSSAIHPSSSRCNPPTAAAELVSEASNRPGEEWNTGGVVYGELVAPTRADSCYDETEWLANPAMFAMGATRLGDDDDPNSDWGYFATVHPTVTRITFTADGEATFTVDTEPLPERPDGPRFAAFTVPPDTHNVTIQLLDDEGTTVIEWDHTP
jgi:hypothetical protein